MSSGVNYLRLLMGASYYDDERGLTPNEERGRGKVHYFNYQNFIFGIIEIYIIH
jgi:hypothetical protein